MKLPLIHIDEAHLGEAGLNEAQLVCKLKAQDSGAFGYLYDHYAPTLYGIVLRIVRNEEIAREIIQDVFLKAWHNIGQYTAGRGRLFTWLFHLARNLSIDKLRGKEMQWDLRTDAVADNLSAIDNKYYDQQQIDYIGIENLLRCLQKEQYFVINLLYLQGYTHAQIAKEYGIPLGTVKTRHRRALIHLRELVREDI